MTTGAVTMLYRNRPSWCIVPAVVFVNFILRVISATAVSLLLALLIGDTTSSWDDAYRTVLSRADDSVPVAEELLVIEGRMPLQPQREEDIAPGELLWTLAELGADRVLLPESWGGTDLATISAAESDSEATSRIETEFARIDENIVELFEAIRMGSIAPGEADRFVAHLRQLVAESAGRVQEEVIQDTGPSRISVADVVNALGSDRVALELPQLGIALPRYPSAEALAVYPGRAGPNGDEAPIRHLSVSSLRRYVSQYEQFARRMRALEEAGYFDQADPRDQPSIMRDYLRSLRRELYEQSPESRVEDWENATERYLAVAEELIGRDRQAQLLERLEALEDTEDLDDESAVQIRAMKEDLEGAFAAARAEYAALVALRTELITAIDSSFVLLEDRSGLPAAGVSPGAERTAVANSVLMGEHRYAPTGWHRALLLAAIGALVGMILAPFRRRLAILLAPGALAVAAAVGGALFVMGDIWIAPVPLAVVGGGAVVSVVIAAGFSQRMAERRITGRITDRVPSRRLKRALARGGLPESATGRRQAAVVVVAPDVRGEGDDVVLQSFQQAIARAITTRGGIVFGEEGLHVFAAFDAVSPGAEKRLSHTVRTVVQRLVAETLPVGTVVRCGIEVGDVHYYTSPIGGYRVTGPAVTYARRLAQLARKHHLRALFGSGFVTAFGDDLAGDVGRFEEAGKLVVSTSGEHYAFFKFTGIDRPSP